MGGDFLGHLQQQHPEYQVRALVRSEQQAALLSAQFPNVKCVFTTGSLRELLISEGKEADVVVQIANTDDEAMSFALLDGVAQHPGATYVHVSGIASLIDPSVPAGAIDPKVFSDAAQTVELLSLPRDRLHAGIEQDIMAKAEQSHTKVAIVSLPRMYGKGRGHITPQSKIIESYLRGAQSHGKVFVVGAGKNVSSHCHVSDASSALLRLVEEALSTESRVKWGQDGYYFVEAGEDSFTNFAKIVGRELHSQGYVSDTDVDSLDEGAVAKIWEWGPKFWGSSSRSRAARLRALGWRASGITEEDTIGETIRYVLGKDN